MLAPSISFYHLQHAKNILIKKKKDTKVLGQKLNPQRKSIQYILLK
jgi:hypothetical protein